MNSAVLTGVFKVRIVKILLTKDVRLIGSMVKSIKYLNLIFFNLVALRNIKIWLNISTK